MASRVRELNEYSVKAKWDIDQASQAFPDLRIALQDYTNDIGQTARLLCLEGTIPVIYKGTSYNIPLVVYFTRQHPYHPPIAYVRPTSNMQIQPSQYVDTNGKIFLPYLSDWESSRSSTKQMLATLQVVFGVRVPVFSKPIVSYNDMMSEEEQLLLSLRSAVLDKLNKEYRDVSDTLNCEIQSLKSTKADLISRATIIETIQAQMISELDHVQSLTSELRAKTKDYKKAYYKLKKEVDGKVDYDSVVDAKRPVYKQLAEAFAEDQAIGDVLYYLSQALEKKAIGLKDFLGAVRDQSRSQFMKRAMVYQCRAQAGLPPV
ncbi:hypothetical protein Aperf_G00000080667 [Anoplocephala perfoliata]